MLALLLGTSHDTTAMPATVYVALITTAPSDANGTGIVEVTSAGAYARGAVTNNSTNWPNAASRAKSNGTTITFPTSPGSWGTVVGYALYDAATTGNFLAYGALGSSQAIGSGVPPQFAAAALTITSPGT